MTERITRKDVELALSQLVSTAGIPQSEGWHIDCYAPDGRKRCVVDDTHRRRPLGNGRRSLRELHDALSLGINLADRMRQYQ